MTSTALWASSPLVSKPTSITQRGSMTGSAKPTTPAPPGSLKVCSGVFDAIAEIPDLQRTAYLDNALWDAQSAAVEAREFLERRDEPAGTNRSMSEPYYGEFDNDPGMGARRQAERFRTNERMSVQTRQRILVDQDGPLADFDRQFFAACDENGWELDCTLESQSHRFATEHILDHKHRQAARHYINTHERWFHDLPPVEGAVEGINRLAEVADVWIVTKPLEANVNCRDGKAAWVREHLGEEWERRLVITPDKSLVHGAVLLDDAPKLGWLKSATWVPVIFTTPWNGPGSKWGHFQHWSWEDPIDTLIRGVRSAAM